MQNTYIKVDDGKDQKLLHDFDRNLDTDPDGTLLVLVGEDVIRHDELNAAVGVGQPAAGEILRALEVDLR